MQRCKCHSSRSFQTPRGEQKSMWMTILVSAQWSSWEKHRERVLPAVMVRNGLMELFLTELAHRLRFFLNRGKRQLQLLRISKVRHFQSPPNVSKSLPVCGYNSPVSQIVLHCGTLVEGNPFLVPQNWFVSNTDRMNVLFAQLFPTLWPLGL